MIWEGTRVPVSPCATGAASLGALNDADSAAPASQPDFLENRTREKVRRPLTIINDLITIRMTVVIHLYL
jgi:hypothetical protein